MPTVTQPGRIQHLFSGIGALLLSLIFLAMGHTALSFSSDSWKRRDCESWPKTTGTILDADIIHTTIRNKRQTQERHSFAVEFEYEYSVDGQTYSGTGDDESHGNQWEAESEFQKKLEETGGEVSVSYSPDEPHISTLSPRNSSILFTLGGFAFAVFTGVFMGGGGFIIGIGHLFRVFFPEQ